MLRALAVRRLLAVLLGTACAVAVTLGLAWNANGWRRGPTSDDGLGLNGGRGATSAVGPSDSSASLAADANAALAGQPPEVVDGSRMRLELTAILGARSDAVTDRDRTAFAKSTVASGQAHDLRVWKVLENVPWQTWRYANLQFGSPGIMSGQPEVLVAADIEWRVKGQRTVPGKGHVMLRFRYSTGAWSLVSEAPSQARQPFWEVASSVRTGFSEKAIVITLGASDVRAANPDNWLPDMAGAASQAMELGDPRIPVVVVVPANVGQLAKVLGRPVGTLKGLGAIAMAEGVPESVSAPRGDLSAIPDRDTAAQQVVYVNREPWLNLNSLARSILSRHELHHVAHDAPSTGQVPLWFEEAAAQWFGYDGSGVPIRVLAGELRSALRRGERLTTFPKPADFSSPGLDIAYQAAWAAADLIVSRAGRAGLDKVYSLTQQGSGDPASNLDQAIAKVLKLDRAGFVSAWQEHMDSL